MKKLLVAILTLQLVFFSPFSYAEFDMAKYAKNSNVKSGSTSRFGYSVMSDTSGKPYLWSGLERKATPSALSKLYKLGGATAAFSLAVTGILGAVDWVMDPDNNRIIYQDPDDQADPEFIYEAYYNPSIVFLNEPNITSGVPNIKPVILEYLRNRGYPDCVITNTTFSDLVSQPYGFNNRTKVRNYRLDLSNCGPSSQDFGIFAKRRTEPPKKDLYLGFEEIAGEVIGDADAGELEAISDTNAANDPETWAKRGVSDPNGDPTPELKANEKPYPCKIGFNAPKSESCFGKSAPSSGTPEENPDSPEKNPEAPAVELPAFCEWAKPACNFFVNSYTSATRFYQDVRLHFGKVDELITDIKTPQPTDTEFTEPEQQEPQQEPELPTVTPITFSTPSACPANPKVNIFLGRATGTIEIPVHLVCFVAEMVRPFVIAGGYLAGASILFRGRES